MKELLEEYQKSMDLLEHRLDELEKSKNRVHGEEYILLMKRISVLKDEIYCMERAMDGIARNIPD